MLKIDCHAHIMPRDWKSQKEKVGYPGWIELQHQESGNARMYQDDGTFFREVKPNCWDPLEILKDMDAYNVDTMILCTIPVLFSYWAKPKDALEWSQFINNHLASVVNDHPKRFLALGTLPMQDVDLAIQELRRCRNELGMHGVEIGSNINGTNLDDECFFPLWAEAQKLQMGIFVHPWEMMGGERANKYWGKWLIGMPAETALAVTSMIFGGVFDKFPDLKVMFAHGAGAFPFTLGRISHGYQCRPDLVNVNNVQDPREYVGRFWVDGITHDRDAFAFLVSVLGADKIAYGTDYPFPLGDLEHGKMIEESDDITDETKEAVFQNSILEFLGMKPEELIRS